MYISEFKYHKPKSLSEAFTALNKNDDSAILAGGTDLLVEIKKGLRSHKSLISLINIKELKSIHEDEKNIYAGACLTHNELILSDIIKKNFPAFSDALSKIGSEQIRNKGTIGGNLCTGASCCDSAPILMAVNASVEVSNGIENRIISLKDLFVFNRITTIKKDEIMIRVIIPKFDKNTGTYYEKFGLREAASISVASVAVMVKIEKNICVDACIVIGAVAPSPIVSSSSTKVLIGKNISELLKDSLALEEIGFAAAVDSVPIDDIRGGAQYRRDILKVITQRAIIKALESVIL